jgi:ATP-dependent DNA ligase
MQRSIAQLEEELYIRGIDPDAIKPFEGSKKVSKKEYIHALQQFEIEKRGGWDSLSWGMQQRLRIESPMLCFSYRKLKEEEQIACMTEDCWLAEKKLDGVRMIITYHPNVGFGFFSRNISVTDFLPVDYTDKILLSYNGKIHSANHFVDKFVLPFIVDGEMLCDEPNIDTTIYLGKRGTVTETKLNAVSTILSIELEISQRIQREQAPLRPVIFDVLQLTKSDLSKDPLSRRLACRHNLVGLLLKAGFSIEEVEGTISGKEKFYSDALAAGEEGIVLKHLDSPYIATSSRSREGFIKRKRSVGESLGKDIDAFITGFVPSNPDKAWGHLIGALEMSVILQYPGGSEQDHTIAAVAGIPMKQREEMTITNSEGKPCLNPDYLNKVLVINGQDLSPKAKRFMHATADWDRGFRDDKSPLDCTMDAKWLETQIL